MIVYYYDSLLYNCLFQDSDEISCPRMMSTGIAKDLLQDRQG